MLFEGDHLQSKGLRFHNEISEVRGSGSAIQANSIGSIHIHLSCQDSDAMAPLASFPEKLLVKCPELEEGMDYGIDRDMDTPLLMVQKTLDESTGWIALEVTGDLDCYTSNKLLSHVVGFLVVRNNWSLVLDLRKLDFIDASGIRCLLRCFWVCRSLGGFCHLLVRPGGKVHQVLSCVGTDVFISPHRSASAAVSNEVNIARSNWEFRAQRDIYDPQSRSNVLTVLKDQMRN